MNPWTRALLSLSIGASSALGASPAAYTLLEDRSDLPLLSPDLKDRKTAKIRLPNGLEILLISDPGTDQSAAAIAIEAGSWSDPVEYPGMAHFCEHMLFMGTEKYPDANEFFSKVSDFDGHTNAFTAPDKTVYMFSSRVEGFLDLLDRFAHFFIDPLFSASNIAREMHAVDQEFALQKENDGWREYMVFKETGNPDHPNRFFSAGNSKTLSNIPQSALKVWHKNHYGAGRMRLAIYSSLPLDLLKEAAAESFQSVPEISSPKADFSQPLTSPQQRGRILSIEPIQNRQTLILTWELPPHLSDDDSKSAELIAYALQRGQKYSLLEKLKAEQLVDGLRVQVDDQGGKQHSFFEITLELSKKGMEKFDAVIARIYQAIAGLKETGVPESLFHEKNALAKLNYQYQSRSDAFQYISSIGRSIADEELSTYPRKSLLASEYHRRNIAETLSLLTPDRCVIACLAPSETTKITYDREEKWLKVPYAIRQIPPDWLSSWTTAKPHPDIRLAEPNPFVPSKLALAADPNLGSIPARIADSNLGSAYYIRCGEFQTPEASIHLHILSPEIHSSTKSQVLSSLYLDHLTDRLEPTLKAASSAGLFSDFKIERNRLHIEISGFSEKASLLLQEILRELPLHPPTREQFELYFARHEKDYSNSLKELAARQARELLGAIVNRDKTTKKEKLAALQTLRYEDLLSFHKKLFEKTYIEALFAGNLSLKSAEASWIDILHAIGKSPYSRADHPQTKALRLSDEEGPFSISVDTEVQGNAALLLIDEGDFTFERRAAQEILSSALQEAFFDTLRTKQRTGYIAQSQEAEFERRLYQYFLVQSNTHQPEDLLHRFELFLEEYRQDFKDNISEKRFDTIKESAISSLKTRYRNVKDKSALWDRLAFEEKGDFSFVEKRIEGLKNLAYERFVSLSEEFLSRTNRRRVAILYTGKIPSPFAYLPTSLPELSDVSNYSPRPSDELETVIVN
jgi:insulysin